MSEYSFTVKLARSRFSLSFDWQKLFGENDATQHPNKSFHVTISSFISLFLRKEKRSCFEKENSHKYTLSLHLIVYLHHSNFYAHEPCLYPTHTLSTCTKLIDCWSIVGVFKSYLFAIYRKREGNGGKRGKT